MQLVIGETFPVIFTGAGAGGGPNEFFATPITPSMYILDISLPAGAQIRTAFYTPLDNIRDFEKFALVDVRRRNNTQVELVCSSYPNAIGRIRLKIIALAEVP
jgi:hypothetical protein